MDLAARTPNTTDDWIAKRISDWLAGNQALVDKGLNWLLSQFEARTKQANQQQTRSLRGMLQKALAAKPLGSK